MRNQEGKIDLEKKVYRLNCVRDITFRLHTLLLMSFFVIFCLLHPSLLLQYNMGKSCFFFSRKWWSDWTSYLPTLNYTAF